MTDEGKPAEAPKQPPKATLHKLTKGETLPTIQVDIPMPAVKPPKSEAAPAPAAKPAPPATGDGKASATGDTDK